MLNKYLVAVLAIMVVVFYAQYYSKYNKDYTIVQTTLDKVNLDLLYERNPIIVYDQLIDPHHLLKSLFAYSYAFASDLSVNATYPLMNTAKYAVLYSQQGNATVNIINPKYASTMPLMKTGSTVLSSQPLKDLQVEYVTIKLKQNQVMILPPLWLYESQQPLQCMQLDDLVSKPYFAIYKLRFGGKS